MKFPRLRRRGAKFDMLPVQKIFGLAVMFRAEDEFVEMQVAPPNVDVHFADGAALSIDESLAVTWSGEFMAGRAPIEGIVRQILAEMIRDGRLLPKRKLLRILDNGPRCISWNDLDGMDGAFLTKPPLRRHRWGFLERRLARSAEC